MISASIYVTYIDRSEEAAPHTGLVVAVVPNATKASQWEQAMWNFFHLGFVLAQERLNEQMEGNFNAKTIANVSGQTMRETLEALRARGALKLFGTVMFGEGLYLFGGVPYSGPIPQNPLEAGAQQTFKLALDIVSDWLSAGKFGKTIVKDLEKMEKRLKRELAKLPVFPIYKPPALQ